MIGLLQFCICPEAGNDLLISAIFMYNIGFRIVVLYE